MIRIAAFEMIWDCETRKTCYSWSLCEAVQRQDNYSGNMQRWNDEYSTNRGLEIFSSHIYIVPIYSVAVFLRPAAVYFVSSKYDAGSNAMVYHPNKTLSHELHETRR